MWLRGWPGKTLTSWLILRQPTSHCIAPCQWVQPLLALAVYSFGQHAIMRMITLAMERHDALPQRETTYLCILASEIEKTKFPSCLDECTRIGRRKHFQLTRLLSNHVIKSSTELHHAIIPGSTILAILQCFNEADSYFSQVLWHHWKQV